MLRRYSVTGALEAPASRASRVASPVPVTADALARVDRRFRSRAFITIGPPGTGKTSRLLEDALEAVEGGRRADRLAIVTFTRAARQEVLDRLGAWGLGRDDVPWARTIHSTAYRLLDLRPDRVLNAERWNELAKAKGYELTSAGAMQVGEAPSDLPRQTADDLLRRAYEWGRNRQLTVEQTIAARGATALPPPRFRRFVRDLEDFKRKERLFDFPDMVKQAVDRGLRPDVDVAYIDEAQDLSPLQILACEAWFSDCERVLVYGDEDQAIYGFQGADPGWLLGLCSEGRRFRVLDRSHRVPASVHRFSMRIIGQNRERLTKAFRPAGGEGLVETAVTEELASLMDDGAPWMVLARNRIHLRRVAADLLQRIVPFVAEGSGISSPLSNAKLRHVAAMCNEVRRSDEVFAIPAVVLDEMLGLVSAGIPRGVKSRVKALAQEGVSLSWSEVAEDLGLSPLLDRVQALGLGALDRLGQADRVYMTGLQRRFGTIPEPRVTLTTIHAAKGREAEQVVLLPGMSKATHDEYVNGGRRGLEAENRVFYVGATRARERLVLVQPRGRRHFLFPMRAAR